MFIGRRLDGTIYGIWTSAQPQDNDHLNIEEVPDTDPDVVAFLSRPVPNTRSVLEEKVDSLETQLASITTQVGILNAKISIPVA